MTYRCIESNAASPNVCLSTLRITRFLSKLRHNSPYQLPQTHLRSSTIAYSMDSNPTPFTGTPRIIDSDFLKGSDAQPEVGVIILNWKLPSITPHLLDKAAFFICADGGANRLYDEVPSMLLPLSSSGTDQEKEEAKYKIRSRYLPHLIKGDLDSIRPDVLEYYKQSKVPVVDLSADQDSTDLQKCLTYIQQHKMAGGINNTDTDTIPVHTILVLGAHGGRLDHILANLSTIHTFRDLNIILCGDGNITRLIRAGYAIIKPYRPLEGPSCGLIPLLGPAIASSRGLRWNMTRMEMKVGGLMSTSNVIEEDEVHVESDIDLIWTTQLRDK